MIICRNVDFFLAENWGHLIVTYHNYIRYKDIGELMRRCETLVATREDLTKMRDRIKATISEEEEALANFKEEQNERILELRYL